MKRQDTHGWLFVGCYGQTDVGTVLGAWCKRHGEAWLARPEAALDQIRESVERVTGQSLEEVKENWGIDAYEIVASEELDL